MAQRKKTRRKRPARKAGPRSALAKLEAELPPTLAKFSRRMATRLTQLERQIERAEARYRRRWTRTLREASHQLGRFEAQGERRWRKLTRSARADAVRALQRLERAIEPPPKRKRKRAPRRKKTVRVASTSSRGSGI